MGKGEIKNEAVIKCAPGCCACYGFMVRRPCIYHLCRMWCSKLRAMRKGRRLARALYSCKNITAIIHHSLLHTRWASLAVLAQSL